MKKAEAISILATSVRPREAKDRARYDEAVKMAIEALKCSETPKSSERTDESAQNVQNEDLISRKDAIDEITEYGSGHNAYMSIRELKRRIEQLPSAKPDRKLIDDYMWKIKQNISPHTAAEGVIAIKYYLEQIYEQIYGEGEKPKWMT